MHLSPGDLSITGPRSLVNLSITGKIPPKGVMLSFFITIFVMSIVAFNAFVTQH